MFIKSALFSGVSLLAIGNAQNAFRALDQSLPTIPSLAPASHFLQNSFCAAHDGHIAEPIKTFVTKCTASKKDSELEASCKTDAAGVILVILEIYLNPLVGKACISMDAAIIAIVAFVNARIVLPGGIGSPINSMDGLKSYGQSIFSAVNLSAIVAPIVDLEVFLGLFKSIDVAALIKVGISDATAEIVVAIIPILIVLILCLSVNIHIE